MVVTLIDDHPDDLLRENALARLSDEEIRILGIKLT